MGWSAGPWSQFVVRFLPFDVQNRHFFKPHLMNHLKSAALLRLSHGLIALIASCEGVGHCCDTSTRIRYAGIVIAVQTEDVYHPAHMVAIRKRL